MKSRSIILAIAVFGGALSCIRSEELVPERVTFRAVYGDAPSSKTTLMEDGSVYWTPNDAINLFFGDLGSIHLTSDSKDTTETTTFSGTLDGFTPNGTDEFWAVYPYSAGNSFDGSVVTLTLPAQQTGVAGTFADDLFISMARSTDYTLSFYNLCGGVKFSVENPGIQYVTFRGNDGEMLAGTVQAAFNADGKPQVTEVAEGVTLLRLDAPNGGFEVGKWYYMVSLPATLSAGYTMTFYDKDDAVVATRERTASVELKRSIWRRVTSADVDNTPISASKYLTFTSEGTTKIRFNNNGGNEPVLYYSLDAQDWKLWDYSELTFNANSPLYFCGDNPNGLSSSSQKYSFFHAEGSPFSVSGDIMSLIDYRIELYDIPSSYCFYCLFELCSLTTAPELPAINLTKACYQRMFGGCSKLIDAPALPASTLAIDCYRSMFSSCSSLSNPPELPANSMVIRCYYNMFNACSSLTTAPSLPATALATDCYNGMFSGCTSLTAAPELPATSLLESCYESMFAGCSSLVEAPELPATSLGGRCYLSMFSYCTSLSSAPSLPAETLYWSCYQSMFEGCSSLTVAPLLSATTLANDCYKSMFSDCILLSSAPELPSTLLRDGCYESMFSGCSTLNHVMSLATDISAEGCVSDWLSGVPSTGTFVKSAQMSDWPTGSSGIPEGWTVKDDGPVSVADVYDIPDGWSVSLENVLVYAVGSRSFVVGDDAAENFINVYYGDDMPFGVQAGDRVSVSAEKIAFMGMPEINNIETVEILSSNNSLPYVTYSPEVGQYDRVTPVRASGLVFQRSNSVYTFNYLLAMEEDADNASVDIQYPPMYLYWPDSQYFDYNDQYVDVEGFWLFRNEAESNNNGLHNILIANVYNTNTPYVDASVQEVLEGYDGMYYKVTATVSQIADTDYGNLYLTDNSSDSQLYIYGLFNLNGLYPKDAAGGWDGFSIAENSVITILGKRSTYNNTIELEKATLIRVSN